MQELYNGYSFPDDRYYHPKSHLWVIPSGNTAIIGVDMLGQAAMGDVVYLVLKRVGKSVQAGERMGSVEAAKMVSPLLAPVSGRILRHNGDVLQKPSLVNSDPYGSGWLLELELTGWEAEAPQLVHGAEPIRRWAEAELARYRRLGWID